MHIPLVVKTGKLEQRGETCDISCGGVLFHADAGAEVGSRIDFSFAMPAKVMGWQRDVKVRCVGRVVRCTPAGTRHSVAAIIDDYSFVR